MAILELVMYSQSMFVGAEESNGGAKTSTKPRAKGLLDLPVEIFLAVEEHILLDEDLSCFIRACRLTYLILNTRLYQRSCKTHNFAIFWAARTGSEETLKKALGAGTDANIEASGFIKLVTDISRHRRSPTYGLVQICHDIHAKTPLILAAAHGNTNIVRVLLEEPCIHFRLVAYGMTAMHWAAFNGHVSAVKLLHSCTKDWGMLGRTPMHLAAMAGHYDIVILLLGSTSHEINVKDPFGLTALHLAARNGHTTIVRALLEHIDTDPNATDLLSRTPLQMALRNRHMLTVEAILGDHRTEVSVRDRHSLEPFRMGATKDYSDKREC